MKSILNFITGKTMKKWKFYDIETLLEFRNAYHSKTPWKLNFTEVPWWSRVASVGLSRGLRNHRRYIFSSYVDHNYFILSAVSQNQSCCRPNLSPAPPTSSELNCSYPISSVAFLNKCCLPSPRYNYPTPYCHYLLLYQASAALQSTQCWLLCPHLFQQWHLPSCQCRWQRIFLWIWWGQYPFLRFQSGCYDDTCYSANHILFSHSLDIIRSSTLSPIIIPLSHSGLHFLETTHILATFALKIIIWQCLDLRPLAPHSR